MIRTKSVHSPIKPRVDGLRVLAARFRGRGLPRDKYDVWMPSLAPSEELLRGAQSGRISWLDFRRKYREELFESVSADKRNTTIKNHGQKFTLRLLQELGNRQNVTFMCHCAEDEQHCHRHILQAILLGRIG